MNSLLSNSLRSLLDNWQGFSNPIDFLLSDGGSCANGIEGLQGSAASFFTASFLKKMQAKNLRTLQYNAAGATGDGTKYDNDIVIVVPNEKNAAEVLCDLAVASPDVPVYRLPWWGMMAYRPVPAGSVVFGERAGILARMASKINQKGYIQASRIFVVTQRVLQTPVPPPEYTRSLVFRLHTGQVIDTVELAKRLAESGYTRVPKVSLKGEFTLRGEVLDIFMPCEKFAYRIQFDFDTIEKIKTFDADTQSTVESVDEILVYPMKEIIWTECLINKLIEYFSKMTAEVKLNNEDSVYKTVEAFAAKKDRILTQLRNTGSFESEELFYPVIWGEKCSVLDYFSYNTPVFYYDYDRLVNSQESLDREYEGMYKKTRNDFLAPCPEQITFKFDALVSSHMRNILLRTLHTDVSSGKTDEYKKSGQNIKIECDVAQSFFGNINYLKDTLGQWQQEGYTVYVYADNDNQKMRIEELLREYAHPVDKSIKPVFIIPDEISVGFSVPELRLVVIQENEIFGRKKQPPKSLRRAKSSVIDTFVDLNPNDYVVHVKYGIGIFRGIERVKTLNNERDYIKIEYADEDFAFVPIEQVNLVQRYIGNEGNNPRIDRIGSKNWENRKNRVKKSVEELAHHLIALYSRRSVAKGFAFPRDSEWQIAFEASFPYEDTPDQMTVTQEVKADMEKPVPMDRLICGDVGYGKTEIAMRAAFKAVVGGKQVAFLAPTTILAEQHYETCLERFEKFPVKVAQLSRFVPVKEQKQILKQLAIGKIDILIGTHRIIQKDVMFKNLGLMIIDEEQRFGVKDKEKLKEMKSNIDCLSLSATPIPRTLHMSLLKIRDMSLLTTPPQNRRSIETVISEYNDNTVAKAIRREVERGGQVFYLHNRVETLDDTRRKIEQLVPEMMVDSAHGQMSSEELDDIFRRFKMGGFHVLVATTIIENGIDIPNVNTIIIDRADMYGISQLYQLRGRVGRSDRTAFAFLMYPPNKAISEIAMKRLQVISDFTELGSGFKIAMKDMEIRGAGNLLGSDQSGDVYSVGFDMYMRLLDDAVKELTESDYKADNEVLLELEYTGFIPDTYVQSAQTKMEIYKKIAGIENESELRLVSDEIEDRYGPIPDEVFNLLSLAKIRIICHTLGISSLKEKNGHVHVTFSKVSDISIDKVVNLIKTNPSSVHLDSRVPDTLLLEMGNVGLQEKCKFIKEKLEQLA